jgi:predicted helicase
MKILLRAHQKDAVKCINSSLRTNNKCLVKMFCGTGKTRIVFYLMINEHRNLTVIVFPSIALITQFNIDYVNNDEWSEFTNSYNYMSICSCNELNDMDLQNDIKYTTDSKRIKRFLNKRPNKIVSVTYKSLENLVNCITHTNVTINLLIYDEAHHTIGSNIQQIVFDNEQFQTQTNKTIFMTATPKNDNGIKMLERNYDDVNYDDVEDVNMEYYSDCGTLAFEYTHYQAVQDGICNDFNIAIDFYADNDVKYKSVYEAIVRSILTTGNNKMLSFHGLSEAEQKNRSNVIEFINDDNLRKLKDAYIKVRKTEFDNTKKQKLMISGITGKTKHRHRILKDFDNTSDNDIYILASCNTIGEGVDTKKCNHICFVDARSSYSTIIQNIGRCTRKPYDNMPKSTILIPCYVDADKYKDCNTDDERDEQIRKDMSDTGNFNSILNVLTALRQDDPELYDLCLQYPDKHAPREIKKNLNAQGFNIEECQGELLDNVLYLVNDIDDDALDDIDTDDLNDISKSINKCIEIYTNSMDNPIERYNTKCKDKIRLYYTDELDEYHPITGDNKKKIQPCRRKRVNINAHSNPDVEILWKCDGDINLSKNVCQAYIESTVKVDKFEETYEKLKEWVSVTGRIPSYSSNDKYEKYLGSWCSDQRKKYTNNILSNIKIKALEHINGWYWNKFNDVFEQNYNDLVTYVNKYGKLPSG